MLDGAAVALIDHRTLERDIAHLTVWHQELLHVLVRLRALVHRLALLVIQLAQRAEVGARLQVVAALLQFVLCVPLGLSHLRQDRLLFHRDLAHGEHVDARSQVHVVLPERERLYVTVRAA